MAWAWPCELRLHWNRPARWVVQIEGKQQTDVDFTESNHKSETIQVE
jgi:hypothetical protein